MSELKPCPLCGILGTYKNEEHTYVGCGNEKCPLAFISIPVNRWNTRPIEDNTRKKIEQMRNVLIVKDDAKKEYYNELLDTIEKYQALQRKWDYKKWAKNVCSQCQRYWTDDRKGCQTCTGCIWVREGKTNYKSGFIKIKESEVENE